ncbi:hypothetical protein QJS66_16620 [Kocuria rhizophila]|nr:hypothetical protein QJS66_16620 [Kocuria rhizophila]
MTISTCDLRRAATSCIRGRQFISVGGVHQFTGPIRTVRCFSPTWTSSWWRPPGQVSARGGRARLHELRAAGGRRGAPPCRTAGPDW